MQIQPTNTWEKCDFWAVGVLRASKHQGQVGHETARGRQCTAIGVCAVAINAVYPIKHWTTATFDQVLYCGTRQYESVTDSEKDCNGYLDVNSVLGTFRLKTSDPPVNTLSPHMYAGIHDKAVFLTEDTMKLSTALEDLISKSASGILVTNSYSFCIICNANKVYFLNSHSCDSRGNATADGQACIIRLDRQLASEFILDYVQQYFNCDVAPCADRILLYYFSLYEIKTVVKANQSAKQAFVGTNVSSIQQETHCPSSVVGLKLKRATKTAFIYWDFSDEFQSVPEAGLHNFTTPFLEFEGIKLLIKDIKTLQVHLGANETSFLKTHVPKFIPQYVNDLIIDCFLQVITKYSNVTFIPCGRSTAIFNGKNHKVILDNMTKTLNVNQLNSVLLPVNIEEAHWILLHCIADDSSFGIHVHNSLKYDAAGISTVATGIARTKSFFMKLRPIIKKWNPTIFAAGLQQDTPSSCGVYLCLNALKLVPEFSLRPKFISNESLRNFIMHVLQKSSKY